EVVFSISLSSISNLTERTPDPYPVGIGSVCRRFQRSKYRYAGRKCI
ncbi:MAG: hypothetical protein AVDCRST_MAG56-7176, partial [uncultured Cytophagales bacterium]